MTDTKNKNNLNSPALRFPGFTEPWKPVTLGDITFNFSRRNKECKEYPMYSVTNHRGFIPQNEQFEDREMVGEDIKSYKIIEYGEFAYNPARINVGSIARYIGSEPCMISSLYVCFKPSNEIDGSFLMQFLKSPKANFYYNANGEGGVRIYLFYPNFARIRTAIPSLSEQRKISSLLSIIDKRITTQRRLIEDMEKLKSSIIDRCYHGNDNIRIGEFISQVSQRNRSNRSYKVMSVSNVRGFVPQTEQFADREIASENTTSYKIVTKDIFAYNPARINIGSIARFKANDKGIVSPMYVCFKVEGKLQPKYLEYFFQTQRFKNEVELRLEGSVRLCLNFDALCEIKVPKLSPAEQIVISSTIETLDNKIALEQTVLSNMDKQRKYLLSSLFI